MLVSSKEILEAAGKAEYAIPATNFMNTDTLKAYIAVAEKLNKPLILQYAEGFKEFFPLEEAAFLGSYYAKKASVPVVLHLDHGYAEAFVKEAIDIGFTSVMIDASEKSFEENVAATKEIVSYAHARSVVVEAEIGHVGHGVSLESDQTSDTIYTEVDSAKKFVELTDVDSLAVSIGTAHGQYKGIPKLNFGRLSELKAAVDVPLVLHGGSGSGSENLSKCCKLGISKVNLCTDFLLAGYAGLKNSAATEYLGLVHDGNKAIMETLENYYYIFNNR